MFKSLQRRTFLKSKIKIQNRYNLVNKSKIRNHKSKIILHLQLQFQNLVDNFLE